MLKTVFEATVKVRDRPVSDRNAGAAGAGNHTSVCSATYVPFTVLKSEVGWSCNLLKSPNVSVDALPSLSG
jgi:hypothetical protein